MTEGDFDNTTSSSLAPEERFESLMGWERSNVLLLCLVTRGYQQTFLVMHSLDIASI